MEMHSSQGRLLNRHPRQDQGLRIKKNEDVTLLTKSFKRLFYWTLMILGKLLTPIYSICAISASICAKIRSSSKRLTEIAPDGQAAPHVPQPLHKVVTKWATLFPFCVRICKAVYGHTVTQMPHPEQISSLIDRGEGYPSFAAIFFRTSHKLENFTFCGQHFSQM